MLTEDVGEDPDPVMLEELNGGKEVLVTLGAVPVDGTIVKFDVGNGYGGRVDRTVVELKVENGAPVDGITVELEVGKGAPVDGTTVELKVGQGIPDDGIIVEVEDGAQDVELVVEFRDVVQTVKVELAVRMGLVFMMLGNAIARVRKPKVLLAWDGDRYSVSVVTTVEMPQVVMMTEVSVSTKIAVTL